MRRLVLVAALSGLLLACGLLQGLSRVQEGIEVYATQLPQTLESQKPTLEAMATQMQALQPTAPPERATPQPGAAGPAQGGPAFQGVIVEQEDIRSGQERLLHTLTVGDQTFNLFEWIHLFDRDKNAEAWIWREAGKEEQRFVYANGMFWFQQGEQWVKTPIDRSTLEPTLLQWRTPPSDAQWKEVGRETVAGLETIRYQAQGPSIPFLFMSNQQVPGMPALAGEPEPGLTTVDIWMTPQGLLAKGQITWELTFPLQDGTKAPGAETILWEVQSLNQPVDIPIPTETEVPPPFPLPEDAQLEVQTSQPPTWIFQVPSWTLDNALTYFRQTLPGQGFQVEEKVVAYTTAQFVVRDPQGKSWEVSLLSPGGEGVQVIIRGMQP